MKLIRHHERMHDEQYRVRVPLTTKTYETKITSNEYDPNLKRVAPVEKTEVIDYVAQKRDYRVSDFMLENMIAVGAVAGLSPTTLSGDTMQSMRNMEKQLKTMKMEKNNDNSSLHDGSTNL